MKRSHCAWGLAGMLVVLGCQGSGDDDVTAQARAAQVVWTVFANPYGNGAPNPAEGMVGFVHHNTTADGRTHVVLQVRGLPPGRELGSHVHLLPCNVNKAGGHYRNDPAGPATPDNEIWLDFTTDAAGNGSAQAWNDFLIRPDGAHAVIIHDHGTDGAGAAGPKLACLDVSFD
jgi:Cu/Zn superoxide dismutase